MRDAFGEIDPDEIDIIEADPSAFGPSPHGDAAALLPAGPTPATASRRSRRTLVAVAAGLAVALAAAALVVWQPWSNDDHSLSLPGDTAAAATLTERLVFDRPPAPLSSSSLGTRADPNDITRQFAEAEGYFFADAGATMSFDGSSDGHWAAFYAVPQDSEEAPTISPDDGATSGTVQGAPATISKDGRGAVTQVDFGPIDGYIISLVASGLTQPETLALAEVVGVDRGVPVIGDSTTLLGMQPIGSMASYASVYSLLSSAGSSFFTSSGTVALRYGDDGDVAAAALATRQVADKRWLQMAQFVLGGPADHAVHGEPAIAIPLTDMSFIAGDDAVAVCWEEGGRLIMVLSHGDVDAAVILAETVRPATDAEWSAVVAAEGAGGADMFGS